MVIGLIRCVLLLKSVLIIYNSYEQKQSYKTVTTDSLFSIVALMSSSFITPLRGFILSPYLFVLHESRSCQLIRKIKVMSNHRFPQMIMK